MTIENVCPSCGTPLDNYTGTKCPSCGTALPNRSSSAQTIISKRPAFNSSAESMDEVKRLVNEGDTGSAAEVVKNEFDQDDSSAQATVEQVKFDMKHSGWETPPVEPEPVPAPSQPEVINAPVYDIPKKSSNSRTWTIAGIAAAVFLCVCCCLPFVAWIVWMRLNR